MRRLPGFAFVLACLVLLPTLAHAQATLAGVVRDASDALLTANRGLMVDNTVNHGEMTTPLMAFFSENGGHANEGRMMIDGLNVAASFNGGGVSTFIYDVANTEEKQVSVSGSVGEAENGG